MDVLNDVFLPSAADSLKRTFLHNIKDGCEREVKINFCGTDNIPFYIIPKVAFKTKQILY